MFDLLKRLFSDLMSREPQTVFADNDPRLAVAALMCHVVAADGVVRPAERQRVIEELAHRYRMSEGDAEVLAEAARRAELESAVLQRFTGGLQRGLPLEERREIVTSLWKVVLADGVVHEFEDNVVWRIADLLGIEAHERVALRKTVEAEIADAALGVEGGHDAERNLVPSGRGGGASSAS